jgi:hypothetical protein
VCTVVCRWQPADAVPVQLLALRDEFARRAFDPPDGWWDEHPGVIGGRDRRAGGSWCVSEIATGVTAVVLNSPQRPTAQPGASSRGVLPLVAVRHRGDWPTVVDVAPMASFHLVLASPEALLWWSYDGVHLERSVLETGTHVFTPRGLTDAPGDERIMTGAADIFGSDLSTTATLATGLIWPQWLAAVRAAVPTEDPSGLLVRRQVGDDSYETVFGQLIAAQPGVLRIDYLDRVARRIDAPWTTRLWTSTAA